MTIKLDGKIIYTSNSAIGSAQNILVDFPGTEVGKNFEIIGVEGHVLGFQDSFKLFKSFNSLSRLDYTRFINREFWVYQKSGTKAYSRVLKMILKL